MPHRVIAYVDGFNLYYGLKEKGWKHCYWLNLKSLIESLLLPGQILSRLKYFTAMVRPTPIDPDKNRRQAVYLDALASLDGFEIIKGHYLSKVSRCLRCGAEWESFEEKMTDVNIATELFRDAYRNQYDVALLISADSDLCRPIASVRRDFPDKRIVVVFPPGRSSKQLRECASAFFTIGRKKLLDARFPDQVTTRGGYLVHRPASWRARKNQPGGDYPSDSPLG